MHGFWKFGAKCVHNFGVKIRPQFWGHVLFLFKTKQKKRVPKNGPKMRHQFLDQFWTRWTNFGSPRSLARLLARSLARSASLAHLLGRWFVRNLMACSIGTGPPLVRSLAGTSLTDSLACLLAGWLAGWLACLLACLLAFLLRSNAGCMESEVDFGMGSGLDFEGNAAMDSRLPG